MPKGGNIMLKETSGHILKIGDRVRMNIPAIESEDLDGIEVTKSGFNYWRWMCQHPEEIYMVTGFDYSNDDETGYLLSGAMAGNNWNSSELILMPVAKTRFEQIKNMTLQEMAESLVPMIVYGLCEEGVPNPESVKDWLSTPLDEAN